MFPLIEVSGSARERGQQHGQEARARIEHSIATYARLFAYCGIDWLGAQRLGAHPSIAVDAGSSPGRARARDTRDLSPASGGAAMRG